MDLEEAPSQRICDLHSGRSGHGSLHCHLESSGSEKDVGSAEVHHRDSAGHWRSNALEDFVEGGNCLAGMEVNIHSHLINISNQTKAVQVRLTLSAHDIVAVGLPIHHDLD